MKNKNIFMIRFRVSSKCYKTLGERLDKSEKINNLDDLSHVY